MRFDSRPLVRFALPWYAMLACESGRTELPRPGAADTGVRTTSAWLLLSETPAIRMSLDTSRIGTGDNRAQVWLAFDLTDPWPAIEDLKAPYRHFEVHEDVDCAARRVRGLASRVVDTTGASYDKPPTDSVWADFATHPLTENAFIPVCAKLVELRKVSLHAKST